MCIELHRPQSLWCWSCSLLSWAPANSCKQLELWTLHPEPHGEAKGWVWGVFSVLLLCWVLKTTLHCLSSCVHQTHVYLREENHRELKLMLWHLNIYWYHQLKTYQFEEIADFYFSCPFKWKMRIFTVNTGAFWAFSFIFVLNGSLKSGGKTYCHTKFCTRTWGSFK